jgi:aminoglycoside phosphotransferase (APT) family kinase protein
MTTQTRRKGGAHAIVHDVYLQPDAGDPVLQDSDVLDLVREFVPAARRVTGVDESGGEARAYAVDDGIIFKVQRPHRLRLSTSLEKEVFFLRQLEKYPSVSVPRVLGYVRRGSVEGIAMTRMPGTPVSRTPLAPEPLRSALAAHGRALAALHGIDQAPFGGSGLFPHDRDVDGLRARVRFRFEGALARLTSVDAALIEHARELGDAILAGLESADQMVALHSNPGPQHTFVTHDLGYSGVIDFGDAYISHPVNDLRRWGLRERQIVLEGYLGGSEMSDGFRQVWEAVYALDAMLDRLAEQGTLADARDLRRLLQWKSDQRPR